MFSQHFRSRAIQFSSHWSSLSWTTNVYHGCRRQFSMSQIIGIDLGTTNSCVSVMDGDETRVIDTEHGSNTTPSVVAFTPDNERLIGTPARRQAISNSQDTFFATKRLIGRRFEDPAMAHIQDTTPYAIVKGKEGDAWVKTSKGKQYSPTQIAAFLLSNLKGTAEKYLGHDVSQAVITVPAYFNDQQRAATRDAGRIAGLDVRRIINEPTAAALYFGIKNTESQTIAVYDLGGGTFDVSILQIADQVFQVKSTNGDTSLGGEDFDNVILDHLVAEFKRKEGLPLAPDALARLREAAEKAKMDLDHTPSTDISLPYLAMCPTRGPVHLDMTLTKETFNNLVKPLINRTGPPCKKALQDAGVTSSQLSQVLLVGGMTRTPLVQKYVKELFGREPSKAVNPDEVVARGAALQAGVLGGSVKDVVLVDVTPLSLGTEDHQGAFIRIINRNTAIPARASKNFTTVQDFQSSVNFKVLQGEREMGKDNKLLGEFTLTGLPPCKRGVPQLEVTFDIDANGIVTCTAKDKGTGNKMEIQVQSSGGLSDQDVERMIREAEQFAEQDKQAKVLMETKNKADNLIHGTESNIKEFREKLDEQLIEEIEKAIVDLRAILNEGSDTNLEKLEETMKKLEVQTAKIGTAIYGNKKE